MQQSLFNLNSAQNWQLEMAKHFVHFPPTLPLYPLSRPCEQGREDRHGVSGWVPKSLALNRLLAALTSSVNGFVASMPLG